ncbi:hypothetical protein RJ640_006940 [Escallonia rubra]|uniref:Sialate O-acetylesterase domain-containing protein n=1 Tax=Escallonia rubra TaxID=112253 RepID=A0AA88QIN7_9ASTE|nr:hypothetical protein RJ640_006940 [Escallonia rubra]
MLSFLGLMLLAFAGLVRPQQPDYSPGSQGKNIFLLAGQSNMAGRGGVVNDTWDGSVPPECRPNPSVLRLSAALRWVEAREPLHKDIDANKTCGIGPGMAFANTLLSKDSSLGVVGLVPCAIGGTRISQWARGGDLYAQLVKRAGAALQGGGTIRALLWYQGESDTESREEAELYKGRLEKFFIDLRFDLSSPMLPIIQVSLASGEEPDVETVRAAQLGLDLPNVRCIDAKGLQLQPDGLHLSTPAQARLGEMLADTFLQTMPSPIQNSAPKRFHNFVFHIFHNSPSLCLLLYLSCVIVLGPRVVDSLGGNGSTRSKHKNIFILAGQSNMAGRGGVVNNIWDGFVPPESRSNPAILRLSSQLEWEEAHEPLHGDIDVRKTCGVGPGMAFANGLLEKAPGFEGVSLVPCAVGGTSITEWARGTRLYKDLVTRARAAEEGGGKIRAILWYQGERDTVNQEDAEAYKDKLKELIVNLRAELHSPLLPVLQVGLASGQGPFLETVREAQLEIDLPNVVYVDAKGLELERDGLHLTTTAQVCLGEMLADAFLRSFSSPRPDSSYP